MKASLVHIALFLLFGVHFSAAGAVNRDSLWNVWNGSAHDTTRTDALHNLAWSYIYTSPDSAIYFARMEYEFSKKINNQKYWSYSLNTIGMAFSMKSEFDSAIYYMEESCRILEKGGDPERIGIAKINIGAIYARQDNSYEALRYMYEAKNLFEQAKDTNKAVQTCINIGVLHKKLGEYEKAISLYLKGLDGAIQSNNRYVESVCYINLGSAYIELKRPDSSVWYIRKAMKIQQERNDTRGLGNSYQILASSYLSSGDLDSSRYYCLKDLAILRVIEDEQGLASAYNLMGRIHFLENRLDSSRFYFLKAVDHARHSDDLTDQMEAHKGLSDVYAKSGKMKEALENYKFYVELRDSIRSTENLKALAQQEMKYEFGKKAVEDSILYENELLGLQLQQEKKQAIAEENSRRNKWILGSVSLVLFLVLGIAFILYRSDKRRKADNEIISQQKEEVELQKHLVEEKNTEIMDSINYAKRIQTAILPPLKLIQSELPDSFVLYLPKDIVAGDFYWAEALEDRFLLAVADCTGHGVPGALVSVVCNNALNRSVREFGLKSPEKILDKTRDLVIETFEKSEDQVKDGMDVSLISLSKATSSGERELRFAGANNPIYLIRNGELTEIKGDKQPVGKFENARPFEVRTEMVQKGDQLILFSDGFADQFGGPRGKKLKYQALKDFLLENQSLNHNDLKDALTAFFNSWKGNFEQVDDVCLISVQI